MNLKNINGKCALLLVSWLIGYGQPVDAQQGWSLERCLVYAQKHNKELLVQRKGTDLALTATGDSKARLLPTMEATASLDHYWQIPVQVFPGELAGQPQGTFIPVRLGTPWMGNAALQAEMPLVDASRWQQIKVSILEQQLKESEYQSTQQLIAKNVRMAFYNAVLVAEQEVVSAARAKDFAQSHRLIRMTFEKGLTDQIAVNQSQALLEGLGDDAEQMKASYQQALLDLKFWMGYPLSDTITLDTSGPISGFDGLVKNFRQERLPGFVRDSLAEVTANASLLQARSSLYPKLTLVSGYSRLGFGSEVNFITRSKWFSSGYVGVRFSVPLFDIRQMHYRLKMERYNVQLALAEKEANTLAGAKSFLAAKLRYSRASRQMEMLENKQLLAEQNVRLAGKKLEKGIIDMIQMKQVQDELTVVQRERLAARLQALTEAVELEYLQGN